MRKTLTKITLLMMLLLTCVSTAVAQENGKMYKLKVAGTSKYLTAFNNSRHQTGAVGGVGVSASTTNENAQIFTFASATDSQGKSGFTLKSEEGRFIKCWKWNIDAINDTDFSVLIFESAGNNQFRIKWFNNENDGWSAHNAEKYIKVQDVSGTEYVFGDASSNDAAQWELEEVQTNVVKSVADLSNNKAYTVTLPGFSKKGWAVNSANLGAITDLSLSEDASDVNQRFAFLTPDNGETYYLYSVGQSKFVNYSGDEAVLSDKPQHSVSFETGNKENTFVVYFDKSHFINVPSERGMIIDGWGPGGTKGSADNGNSVRITAVADFDPTDALSNFGVSPEDFAGYMMLASKYLDRSSLGVVGYPIAEQTVFNNLRTAWATIMGKGYAEGTFDYNVTDCNALIDAYNAYINSTDVKMPEDGKAYVIRNVHQNGNQYMLSSQYENAYMPQATENAKDDVANIFICRTTANGYVFVNGKHGQYMLFYGKDSVKPLETDGFSDAFSGNNELKLNSHNSDLMGSLSIAGKRNSDKAEGYATMTIATNGNMDANEGINSISYSGNFSSLFLFEEVAYPNNVKLTAFGEDDELITDLDGYTIGTFSAPFPTVVSFDPAVEAYYAEQVKGTDYVKLKAIGVTDAIPANQGVILVGKSESATSALMKPAAVERAADLSSNMFAHTAGATTTTVAGDYVLARGNQGIGFYEANAGGTLAMNKAFLRMGTSNVAAFRLVVDEEVTAIDGVTTEKVDAPIYDLSGRRVLNTIKGGIYIQNGKKFIVK